MSSSITTLKMSWMLGMAGFMGVAIVKALTPAIPPDRYVVQFEPMAVQLVAAINWLTQQVGLLLNLSDTAVATVASALLVLDVLLLAAAMIVFGIGAFWSRRRNDMLILGASIFGFLAFGFLSASFIFGMSNGQIEPTQLKFLPPWNGRIPLLILVFVGTTSIVIADSMIALVKIRQRAKVMIPTS